MKRFAIVCLLIGLAMGHSYTLPDLGINHDHATCSNWEKLLKIAIKQKAEMESLISNFPAVLKNIRDARGDITNLCALDAKIKPLVPKKSPSLFLQTSSKMGSQARAQATTTAKKMAAAVSSLPAPMRKAIQARIGKITDEFTAMIEKSTADLATHTALNCTPVNDGIVDLFKFMAWSKTEIKDKIIDHYLVDRISTLQALNKSCSSTPAGHYYERGALFPDIYSTALSTKKVGQRSAVFRFDFEKTFKAVPNVGVYFTFWSHDGDVLGLSALVQDVTLKHFDVRITVADQVQLRFIGLNYRASVESVTHFYIYKLSGDFTKTNNAVLTESFNYVPTSNKYYAWVNLGAMYLHKDVSFDDDVFEAHAVNGKTVEASLKFADARVDHITAVVFFAHHDFDETKFT